MEQSSGKKSGSKNIDLLLFVFTYNFQQRLVILDVMIIFES